MHEEILCCLMSCCEQQQVRELNIACAGETRPVAEFLAAYPGWPGLTARVARSDCPGGQVQPPGRVTLSHARLSRQLQGNFDTDLHNA